MSPFAKPYIIRSMFLLILLCVGGILIFCGGCASVNQLEYSSGEVSLIFLTNAKPVGFGVEETFSGELVYIKATSFKHQVDALNTLTGHILSWSGNGNDVMNIDLIVKRNRPQPPKIEWISRYATGGADA